MSEPDRRGALWGCDPDDPVDLMVIEIATGVPKERARSIRTADDAAQWERMTAGIRAIEARGGIVTCDNGAGADD